MCASIFPAGNEILIRKEEINLLLCFDFIHIEIFILNSHCYTNDIPSLLCNCIIDLARQLCLKIHFKLKSYGTLSSISIGWCLSTENFLNWTYQSFPLGLAKVKLVFYWNKHNDSSFSILIKRRLLCSLNYIVDRDETFPSCSRLVRYFLHYYMWATDWLLEEMLLRDKEETTLNIFLKYFEFEL